MQGISNHHMNEEIGFQPKEGKYGLNYNTRHKNDVVQVTETVSVDSGRRESKGSVIMCTKRRLAYRHR